MKVFGYFVKRSTSQVSNRVKTAIALSVFAIVVGTPIVSQSQGLPGATTPQPEFTRENGGCSQFGKTDPGRVNSEANEAATRVLVELIMRRCVLEGVPVTTAEEDRIYPLIKALVANFGGKTGFDAFLAGARPILDPKRMARVEAHVAAALAPSTAPRTSERAQMITTIQPVGNGEMLQPEFTRGSGCSVFGTTDAGKVSRKAQEAVTRVVLQSVFRRCLLENVPLTAAEDERLFPALRALAQGAGPRQYNAFVEAARRTLDKTRADRVAANVAQARSRR